MLIQNPLSKSLKLLKLEDLLSLNVLKLYYKVCHGDLPVYITNLFTRIFPGSTHDYDLRPSGILKTPTVHTCVAERCVRFMLPKIINDADRSITEKVYTHSFQRCTNYVTMIKIDSYATHCLIANCYMFSSLLHGEVTDLLLIILYEIVCFMLYFVYWMCPNA